MYVYTRAFIYIYSGREVRELGFTWDIAPQATVTPEDSGLTDIDYTVEPFSDAISNGHPRESKSERERASENE